MGASEFSGTPEAKAVMSLLDVVEEIANALHWGQVPNPEWLGVLSQTFDAHRAELRGLGRGA